MKTIWKEIPGHPDYFVSNKGQVKSTKKSNVRNGECLKSYDNGLGYQRVKLKTEEGAYKQHLVHRLVALVFIGLCPQGKEVNHINHIKADNRVENLEYVSKKENSYARAQFYAV